MAATGNWYILLFHFLITYILLSLFLCSHFTSWTFQRLIPVYHFSSLIYVCISTIHSLLLAINSYVYTFTIVLIRILFYCLCRSPLLEYRLPGFRNYNLSAFNSLFTQYLSQCLAHRRISWKVFAFRIAFCFFVFSNCDHDWVLFLELLFNAISKMYRNIKNL